MVDLTVKPFNLDADAIAWVEDTSANLVNGLMQPTERVYWPASKGTP